MNPLFEQIDQLKKDWASSQPLSAEAERKLWQKIRLDWNYHSNHIEGNTLTYGETQLLLLHGQTHGDHQLREYEEMKAHDVGIAHVRELANDPRFIGEGDVRNLNKIILKEAFWKDARTADGQPSRKQIIPGDYKSTPNNVITATGELFEFAPPAEVPIRMRELLTQLEERLGDGTSHIAGIIAWFHHQFVLIHPFDDGNGRVARLLVNYLLLRGGYLPIIVPTEEKASYLGALRLADAGESASFAEYLGQRIKAALEMGIRASKGESIEEPGDLEKEIQLFIRDQEGHREKVRGRNPETMKDLYESCLRELLETLVGKVKIFEPLFLEIRMDTIPRWSSSHGYLETLQMFIRQSYGSHDEQFNVRFYLEGYRGEAINPFTVESDVTINFGQFQYSVQVGSKVFFKHLYSQPVLIEQMDAVVKHLLQSILDEIKVKAQEITP